VAVIFGCVIKNTFIQIIQNRSQWSIEGRWIYVSEYMFGINRKKRPGGGFLDEKSVDDFRENFCMDGKMSTLWACFDMFYFLLCDYCTAIVKLGVGLMHNI